MRIAIFIAAASLAVPAAAVPLNTARVIDPTAGSPANCPPISRYDAARKGGKATARPLGDLPAADQYKAVYRRVGGCIVPMISSFGLGLTPKSRR